MRSGSESDSAGPTGGTGSQPRNARAGSGATGASASEPAPETANAAASIVGARRWIVLASLSISGAFLVFCALAPALGFPGLDGADALRLLEITLPVFLGYLGSAVQFLFGGEARIVRVLDPVLLVLLVRGPVVIFGLTVAVSLTAYGISHRAAAPVGSGLDIEVLAGLVAASMGLLAATTNVIVGYLFGMRGGKRRH